MKMTVLLLLLGSIAIIAIGTAFLWSSVRKFRRELGLDREKPEKTQDVSFIIAAFQDVTRQLKEKEKELNRLRAVAERRADAVESYTEHILRSVPSGVITFDEQGLITTVNRAAVDLLGAEQPEGKSCAALFGGGDICDAVRRTLETREATSRLETAYERGGDRKWLGFTTSPLTDRLGVSLGAILTFSDLTEVKRLQEQMELRERLTALGEMSAGIAHELRNPMAVVSGYLALLAKKLDEPGKKVIRDITVEINGMNRIIGDLLTFARPTALNRMKIDLQEMIEGCIANLLQARKETVPVRTELRLSPVRLNVDEGLLRQAFTNILQNAFEAMPDGGTLAVSTRESGREASVVIRDGGAGIPENALKKIFLPFFTTKDAGVGMGLALAHKIITSHGGRVEVKSGEGEGTTFTVTLPKG